MKTRLMTVLLAVLLILGGLGQSGAAALERRFDETAASACTDCHAWKIQKVQVSTAETMHGRGAYVCASCGAEKQADLCACEVFRDVPAAGHWSHAGIDWAFLHGITTGTTAQLFRPDKACTRGQVVTFLYRAAGSPSVSGTVAFTDVKQTDFCYDAVRWAYKNRITEGVTATTFAPNKVCTRAQVVTFLYRAAGSPEVSGAAPFTDVKESDYFYNAVRWAYKNNITSGVTATAFAPGKTCTRAQVVVFLHRDSRIRHANTIWDQSYSLYYGDVKLEERVFCQGNRAYVSKTGIETVFGGTIPSGSLRWPLLESDGRSFTALVDAAEHYKLGVLFREEDFSVHLYKLGQMPWSVQAAQSGQKAAYIRLEDLMPDYGLNNRFTHESLLKLRLFGVYLRDHSDGFYLAWIPLYVNGPKALENDISTTFNFYNADFVFSLDSLLADGGQIGLHGLTHQDAEDPNSVSASGYEFGVKHEDMTEAEIVDRFERAKQIAAAMGYSWTFFEFPHYATTAFQREVADKHFDVIYQQDPDVPYSAQGNISTHTVGNRTVRWIPTPADYVDGRSDLQNMLNRLQSSHDKKKLISLFFHPHIDTIGMQLQYSGTVLTCTYDQETNVIPRIVQKITELGYRFGCF